MSTFLAAVSLGCAADPAPVPSENGSLVSVRTGPSALVALLERFPYPCVGSPCVSASEVDEHLVSLVDATLSARSAIADVMVLPACAVGFLDQAFAGWAVAVIMEPPGGARVLTRTGWSADLVHAAGTRTRPETWASYGSLVHAWQVTGRSLEGLDDAVLSVGRDRHHVRSHGERRPGGHGPGASSEANRSAIWCRCGASRSA
ncbi:hypothetical protein GCM10022221_65770 [Actinocorallia aurea]